MTNAVPGTAGSWCNDNRQCFDFLGEGRKLFFKFNWPMTSSPSQKRWETFSCFLAWSHLGWASNYRQTGTQKRPCLLIQQVKNDVEFFCQLFGGNRDIMYHIMLKYSMTGIKGPTLLLRSSSNRIMFKFWHLIKIFLR